MLSLVSLATVLSSPAELPQTNKTCMVIDNQIIEEECLEHFLVENQALKKIEISTLESFIQEKELCLIESEASRKDVTKHAFALLLSQAILSDSMNVTLSKIINNTAGKIRCNSFSNSETSQYSREVVKLLRTLYKDNFKTENQNLLFNSIYFEAENFISNQVWKSAWFNLATFANKIDKSSHEIYYLKAENIILNDLLNSTDYKLLYLNILESIYQISIDSLPNDFTDNFLDKEHWKKTKTENTEIFTDKNMPVQAIFKYIDRLSCSLDKVN